MLLRRNLLVVIYVVIIASGAVSGTEVVKAVGGEVSFGPDNPPPPPVSSITWKHIKGGETVKAIEWEDEEIQIPNTRFKGITTLDTKTGKITITKLTVEHSGVYTIDISGKEQEKRFTLTVMEPVPQPKIKVELITDNPGAVYLSCKYNETVIWKNSAGKILTGSAFENTITVEKNGDPEEFYTCTLENKASIKTSERVYEKDLFKDQSEGGLTGLILAIVFIVIIVIICIICALLYKRNKKFKDFVDDKCACIKGKYTPASTNSNDQVGKMEENNGTNGNSSDNPPQNPEGKNPPPKTEGENPLMKLDDKTTEAKAAA